MKTIKKLKTVAVCSIFLALFLIVASMILLSRIYPDGHSGNRIAQYLLSNLTIQTVISNDEWAQKYPYNQSFTEKYEKKIQHIKTALENFCTTSFPASEKIDSLVNLLKHQVFHYHADDIIGNNENIMYVQDAVANVTEFSQILAEKGIPFLYVQTPSPGSVAYYRGSSPDGTDRMLAERNHALTDALVKLEVNTLNLTAELSDTIQFDKTAHWFPEDALYAANIITARLNQDFGFGIHADIFSGNNFTWHLQKDSGIASQIQRNWGYRFDVPVPKEEYIFSVVHAETDRWSGNFAESMLQPTELWRADNVAYHGAFRISNSLIYEITNQSVTASTGKHILMIGDSFDWPLCAYLAMGVEQLTFLHNASFTGSILSYIDATSPDAVLICYNDAEFHEVYTEEAYYLE